MNQVSREGRRVVPAYALLLLAGLHALCPVGRVAACSLADVTFAIDSSLRDEDGEAPKAFGNVTAFTRRITATRCTGNRCTQSSCGDRGQLELQFDAREADTGTDGIGYRIVWLSGELPDTTRRALDGVKPLLEPGRLTLDVGWSEVTSLSGELALIAVDHAGNESAQSDPVHLEWSGCTSYWDDLSCHTPGASQVAGGAAHGCTIGALDPARGDGAGAAWVSFAIAAAACAWRVRTRRAAERG